LLPVIRYGTHNKVIKSFADKLTAAVFANRTPKGFPTDVLKSARRKLAILDAAEALDELKSPPGNRLEALKDDRKGQHSIRINEQWRVCFVWRADGPHEVEIVDYH
jgi:proteic killer suppression protein